MNLLRFFFIHETLYERRELSYFSWLENDDGGVDEEYVIKNIFLPMKASRETHCMFFSESATLRFRT